MFAWMWHLRLRTLSAFVCLSAFGVRAEDVIHVSVGENTRSRTRLTGEVLDYTGKALLVRLPGGIERAFPADRVHAIETTRTPEQQSADKLYAQRQPEQALGPYRKALEKEERRWVRREILAQITSCHHELGDEAAAVQAFLLLVQSDPQTPYFDRIPVTWLPAEPAPALVDAALKWLARENDPVANLLGASHLLNSPQKRQAIDRLRSLSFDPDPRVAWLSRGQFWRTGFATASDVQIENWTVDVEKAPESLRGGTYYLLGQALSNKHQPAKAALAYLRVSVLYPRDRRLAGRSLLEAGRELEKIGQKNEAATLYREVIDTHPQNPLAAEAQERLAAVTGK